MKSKSMGPDVMHPECCGELVDVIVKPLLSILKVYGDWKKFMRTERKHVSLLSLRRCIQGTIGQPASVPGSQRSKSSWRPFPDT